MKNRILLLTASLASLAAVTSPLSAELRTLTEKHWLGHFTGWTGKDLDFGLGTDGKGLIWMLKGKDRVPNYDFNIDPVVEEQIADKWVRRRWDEGALESEYEGGENPGDPVAVTYTFTGGTKVEYTFAFAQDTVTVKLKEISKTTTNPLRLGLEVKLPDLYKGFESDGLDERDIRKKLRSDSLEAVRKSDGEKVEVKAYEEVDLDSEDQLGGGLTKVEVEADRLTSGDFFMELGDDSLGKIDYSGSGKMMDRLSFTWWPDSEKLAEPRNYVSFGLK